MAQETWNAEIYVSDSGAAATPDEEITDAFASILMNGVRGDEMLKKSKLAVMAIAGVLVFTGACGSSKKAADEVAAVKPVAVTTAMAVSREVPADFEETGTFVADESSDIAPLVAGRVISTPVDVGARVTQGQIICELDHRDAELKLQQARAQLQEANAGVRQAQSRIGWVSGEFDPTRVPEVAAALANYQSALAQAKLAAADAQRYANLVVATGDVSRSTLTRRRIHSRKRRKRRPMARSSSTRQRPIRRGRVRKPFPLPRLRLKTSRRSWHRRRRVWPILLSALGFDGCITARPVAAGEYVALTNKIATIVRIGEFEIAAADAGAEGVAGAFGRRGDRGAGRLPGA